MATRRASRSKRMSGGAGRSRKSQRGGASAWLKHVKSVYASLKKKSKTASLGDAMKAAKKSYKKSRK